MTDPIDFYYWPTPNGWKVSIMLEELALPYRLHLVDINRGDQFSPEFLAISPNNRMPAIVDPDGPEGPLPVFESGAILTYLAEKTGRFAPSDPLGRKELNEWLFWQVGNLGPMAGQHSHFRNYAHEEEKQSYAAGRYRREYIRCIEVLDRRLEGRAYVLGEDYTIADMISWPWILIAPRMDVSLDPYRNVSRWRQAVKERPAVQRGVALAKDKRRSRDEEIAPETRALLFGQGGGGA